MLQSLLDHKEVVLAVLLSLSELLALVPAIKANGIVDGVIKALKQLGAKSPKDL